MVSLGPKLAALLCGATLYVAPGGTGDGSSPGAPLPSVQQAVTLARPGDEIVLAPGRYAEHVYAAGDGGVTLRAADAGVIIDGQTTGIPLAIYGPNWVIRGISLENGRDTNLWFSTHLPGACFSGAPGSVEIDGVHTRGSVLPSSGDCATDESFDLDLECVSGPVWVHHSTFAASTCGASAVFHFFDGQDQLTFEDNQLSGGKVRLLQLLGIPGGLVQRNTLLGTGAGTTSAAPEREGIYIEPSSSYPGARLFYNLIVDTEEGISVWDYNNGCADEHYEIAHNTVVRARADGIALDGVSGSVEDNLISATPVAVVLLNGTPTLGTQQAPSVRLGYNLIHATDAGLRVGNNAVAVDAGPWVRAEPGFVSSNDFRLTADSGAIDRADPSWPASTDLAGNAVPWVPPDGGAALPDIGAYEYSGPLPELDAGGPDGGADGGANGGSDGGPGAPDAGIFAAVDPAEQEVEPSAEAVVRSIGSHAAPGASLTAFEWTQRSGPAAGGRSTTDTLHFSASAPGRYEYALRVHDSLGNVSAPAVARITVRGDTSPPRAKFFGCQSTAGLPGLWALAVLLALSRRARSDASLRRREW